MRYLFLLLLLAAPLLSAQQTELSVPYTKVTLDNGLTVILHEDHSVPVISVNIWYHVGSGHEKPGRTGFAHLFEHIMFEGSGNVPEGKFDQWLEAVGGSNNGSTNGDRTNYYEDVPANAVETALFLESDRLGYLLEDMSPGKVDGQRDVVKNEKRQNYENTPYNVAWILLPGATYPEGHPYSWSTIGSMEDLSAATYDDVVEFFKKYYVPNNASLAIAGDFETEEMIATVKKWFSEIPAGDPVDPFYAPPVKIDGEKRIVQEDKVQLPRLYMSWITPRFFAPGDAACDIMANVLSGGKNSRLYKRLVYDLQIAQDVSAFQSSSKVSSEFMIIATARDGVTLSELETVIQEELEKLKAEAPTQRELERAVNQFEAGFFRRLQNVGGFSGKANSLNSYYYYTGNPDYFNEDLYRYKSLAPSDIQAAAKLYLLDDARVILSIVPEGRQDLAATKTMEGK